MKSTNLKIRKTLQSETKTQTVEMILYFDGHENDHRAFWASYDMDAVRENVDVQSKFEKKFRGFRKSLLDYLLRTSLVSNPDPLFYNCALTYLCGVKSIQREINKYPDGGYGIIGHFNYQDESCSDFQFLDPDTFKAHLKNDYSVTSFQEPSSGVTLLGVDTVICEGIDEALFLSFLVELIKTDVYSCCNLSNDDLLKVIPVPMATVRIPEILGKLESLEIIGIITYTSNGLNWYRDIFLKFPANHIQFVTQQRISA